MSGSTVTVFGRYDFLIRRLHSLSGLIPVGAYLCVHLATNASVINGAAAFQDNVDKIHSLGVILPVVEWTFIFIPIIFHALAGVVIAVNASPNTSQYTNNSNVRYTLQRVTAWIALIFIFWHVFHLHGWLKFDAWLDAIRPMNGARFDPHHAASSTADALAPLAVRMLYTIGMLSTVFHFANGIWTMGITWGVWTSPPAQRRALWACGGLGVIVAFLGLSSLFGFSRVNIDEARAIESSRTGHAEGAAPSVVPETGGELDAAAEVSSADPGARDAGNAGSDATDGTASDSEAAGASQPETSAADAQPADAAPASDSPTSEAAAGTP